LRERRARGLSRVLDTPGRLGHALGGTVHCPLGVFGTLDDPGSVQYGRDCNSAVYHDASPASKVTPMRGVKIGNLAFVGLLGVALFAIGLLNRGSENDAPAVGLMGLALIAAAGLWWLGRAWFVRLGEVRQERRERVVTKRADLHRGR